jgi:histidine ammonia-lyase
VGEGEAFFQGERMSGADALLRSGLTPIELAPKEGLSMVSSTHVITGQAALSLANTLQLAKQCDIALALSLEALRGRPDAFDERTHHAKGYLGPQQTAANVRRLIEGSDLYDRPPSTVQDAYTLRCAAQVHGAAREALTFVRQIIESEANSSSDNPLVFVGDDDIVSGGNFHGEAVAIASDVLGIACSELASFSERRTAWLVNHKRTDLPAFLTRAGGLNSGLMIPQYIAVSLVTENLVLAGPASIYSIPTSADQEDFVSSGPIASAKVQTILANAQYVTAIELLCAAQAVDLRSSLRLGRGTFAAHQLIRRDVPFLGEDRILVGNIEHLRDLVHSGELLKVVSDVVGPLD